MKIILCLIICAITTFIGNEISKVDKKKKDFYADVLNFIDYLSTNISYSHKLILQCIEEYEFKTKALTEISIIFRQCIEKKEALNQLKLNNINFLSEQQKDEVISLFESLGKLDEKNMIESLSHKKKLFELDLQSVLEKNKKIGNLPVKLGLISGLAISLLII